MKSLLRPLFRWYLDAFESQLAFSERFTVLIGALLVPVSIGLSASDPAFHGQRLYNFFLLSLIGITGGLCGWLIGIFLSPLGSQHGSVKQVATAISAFWSGVIIANLGAIRSAFVHHASWAYTGPSKLRLLYGLTLFLLALAGTFNSRFSDSQIDSVPKPTSTATNFPPA